MKKKFFSFLIAICMLIPCALMLTACGKDDDSSKVMNVSLNPEVEFVLDKNNKVVSVNALDDDGNHIVSLAFNEETAKSAFEGLTAEDAIDLFLEMAEENGYLITGDEETITINVSGKADKLIKKVKEKAQAFFDENNLVVNITTGKIDKAAIEAKVKECLQEYTSEQLASMSQEELIALLKQSRQETADLFTQELKDAYYGLRAEKLNIAQLESLNNLITNLPEAIVTQLKAFVGEENWNALTTNLSTLVEKIEAVEDVYAQYYLSADDDNSNTNYYEAKQAYAAAKEALLQQRLALSADGSLSEEDKTALEPYQTAVDTAIANIETAEAEAIAKVDEAKQAVQTAVDAINTEVLQTVKAKLNNLKETLATLHIYVDDLNSAFGDMVNDFKDHFKDHENFEDLVGKHSSHWSQQPLEPAPAQ